MANSIDISYANGIYTVRKGTQVAGQGRSLETALENATSSQPPDGWLHSAAEVLMNIMGPPREAHSQIATREP